MGPKTPFWPHPGTPRAWPPLDRYAPSKTAIEKSIEFLEAKNQHEAIKRIKKLKLPACRTTVQFLLIWCRAGNKDPDRTLNLGCRRGRRRAGRSRGEGNNA